MCALKSLWLHSHMHKYKHTCMHTFKHAYAQTYAYMHATIRKNGREGLVFPIQGRVGQLVIIIILLMSYAKNATNIPKKIIHSFPRLHVSAFDFSSLPLSN